MASRSVNSKGITQPGGRSVAAKDHFSGKVSMSSCMVFLALWRHHANTTSGTTESSEPSSCPRMALVLLGKLGSHAYRATHFRCLHNLGQPPSAQHVNLILGKMLTVWSNLVLSFMRRGAGRTGQKTLLRLWAPAHLMLCKRTELWSQLQLHKTHGCF